MPAVTPWRPRGATLGHRNVENAARYMEGVSARFRAFGIRRVKRLVFTDEQRQRLKRIRKQHREFHRRKRLAAQYDAFAASMAREQAELEAEAARRGVDVSVVIRERLG